MNGRLYFLSSGVLLVDIKTDRKEGKSYKEYQESVVVAVVLPAIWAFLILSTVIRQLLQYYTAS